MNPKILVVLPFSANDGVMAEHLCDFIYLANRRVQEGHCLLVVAGDVHDEMREKVRVAAQVAFEGVDVITAPKKVDPNKNVHVNHLFRVAAEHIAASYRTPFLWLEPDCVPLKYGWLDKLAEAHFDQPKRYSGPLKRTLNAEAIVFLNRVAIYPPDCIKELAAPLGTQGQFNLVAGPVVAPKATKTTLIQEVAFADESTIVSPSAVLLHADKQGTIMNQLRDKFEQAAKKK